MAMLFFSPWTRKRSTGLTMRRGVRLPSATALRFTRTIILLPRLRKLDLALGQTALSSPEGRVLAAACNLAPDCFLSASSCPLPRATLPDITKAGVKHRTWDIMHDQLRCSEIHRFASFHHRYMQDTRIDMSWTE